MLKAQLIARDNKIAELQRMIQSLKKELIEYDEKLVDFKKIFLSKNFSKQFTNNFFFEKQMKK